MLNKYAKETSDKFTLLAKDNDFKHSKFQRFIDETKALTINVKNNNMTKKEFDKINEIFRSGRLINKNIENEVKLFKFYKNDSRPFLGKLEQKSISLNEDSSFYKKLTKKRPQSYNIRASLDESIKTNKKKLSSNNCAVMSTREMTCSKTNDISTLYSTHNPYSKFKIQSAFLPSPKQKDLNGESSMCIRLSNNGENLDISSGTESFAFGRNARNYSKDSACASKYSNSFIQLSDIQDRNVFEYDAKQGYKNKSKDHATKEYYKNAEFANRDNGVKNCQQVYSKIPPYSKIEYPSYPHTMGYGEFK